MAKMIFTGTCNDKQYKINIIKNDDNYLVTIDEQQFIVNAKTITPHVINALIDNKSYDININHIGDKSNSLDGRLAIKVRGEIISLEILDERRMKIKNAQVMDTADHGSIIMKSPMPGKILKIFGKEGESVEKGEGLIIIEAMKMENEICSPKKGLIKEIFVEPNQSVQSSSNLLSIE